MLLLIYLFIFWQQHCLNTACFLYEVKWWHRKGTLATTVVAPAPKLEDSYMSRQGPWIVNSVFLSQSQSPLCLDGSSCPVPGVTCGKPVQQIYGGKRDEMPVFENRRELMCFLFCCRNMAFSRKTAQKSTCLEIEHHHSCGSWWNQKLDNLTNRYKWWSFIFCFRLGQTDSCERKWGVTLLRETNYWPKLISAQNMKCDQCNTGGVPQSQRFRLW